MSAQGSVTYWIHQLQAGNQAAVQKLWEGYFERLVGLARKKLQGTPRQVADEEDVALSAFDSFCRHAEAGRFPQLVDRQDLWQLLVVLTGRKALNLAKHEGAAKRGGGKVRHASALASSDSSAVQVAFTSRISKEPDPQFAAEVAEECRRLLALLNDEELRSIAVLKMEGHTNEEIATKLGRSLPTVERKLGLIRRAWEKELRP
jgi:DNA-directed RNA polymerase specialized sigma24 family protein